MTFHILIGKGINMTGTQIVRIVVSLQDLPKPGNSQTLIASSFLLPLPKNRRCSVALLYRFGYGR